ncbi:MAG: HD domain-containing protein [Elusimicrobia bacterium]|nr:HD domain-containing protein [Elusimicrobiota bacterium]
MDIELQKKWELLDRLIVSLTNIHELSSAAYSHKLNEELYEPVLENACNLIKASRGSIMLFDEKSQTLNIIASKGISAEVIASTRLKSGEGVAGLAFQTGKIITTEDPGNENGYVGYIGAPEQREPFVAIPIRTRKKVLGVLNLHVADYRVLKDEYVLKILAVLADKTAITVENVGLNEAMRGFYLEMVETLTRVIDAKDSYTHDHGARASARARRISEEMGLEEDLVREIEYAALLHDIGKIGISELILRKPSRLTPQEYETIKKHTAIGYQILHPIQFLGRVPKMVLHHHEWFNGSGYPAGLKGEEIPIGSRVVSVIDAWDAMVSDRPYRKALSFDRAIEELEKGRGEQFDPKVVDVFVQLFRNEWSKLDGAESADNHSHTAGQP